jgi:hypothetical protein
MSSLLTRWRRFLFGPAERRARRSDDPSSRALEAAYRATLFHP